MNELYFDYNATTPVHPEVFEAMRPFLQDRYGNPGSAHMRGRQAKIAVARAREQVAGLIGADPEQVVFTSCATESNNLALFGFFGYPPQGDLVVSTVEHPAVLEPASVLEERGVRVTRADVDGQGRARLEEYAQALQGAGQGRRLVSLMLANNETGVIQPVAELAGLAREHDATIHADAAQAVAKIRVNVWDLGLDLMTIAGHKIYAPKGVGALFVRDRSLLTPQLFGGGQEGGLRPGTENTAYVAGLGRACVMAGEDLDLEEARQRDLGRQFLTGLGELGREFVVFSDGAERLPCVACVGFRNLAAGDILSGLVGMGVAASGGAACHSGQTTISPVLAAMDAPLEYAAGAVRFSWGRMTSVEDMDELLRRLGVVLGALD